MSSVVLVLLVVVVVHLISFMTCTELKAVPWLKVLHQWVSWNVHVLLKLFNPMQELLQVALHTLIEQVAGNTLQLHCVVALYFFEGSYLFWSASKKFFDLWVCHKARKLVEKWSHSRLVAENQDIEDVFALELLLCQVLQKWTFKECLSLHVGFINFLSEV